MKGWSNVSDETPRVIKVPNLLRAKIGNKPGPNLEQIVKQAEAALDDMSDQYEGWIRDYLETINTAMSKAQVAVPPDPDAIATIRKTSHEIKGQGQTLGYSLLTQAGHMLHGFIDRDEACLTIWSMFGPNLLRAKIGNKPGPNMDQIVKQAEAALDDMSDQYEGWIRDYLETINTAMSKAQVAVPPDPDAIATIRKTSHEIKGQGQTLGYSLLTQAGHMLHGFIDRDEACAARNLDLIAAHIDFMNLVVQKGIHGDGGPKEEMLLGALDQAARKLSKK